MANEKQLAILKKGTEVWNKWRKKNYTIVVDLRGAVLSDANLRGAFLFETNLSQADFQRADLRGASLNSADLTETNLDGADLREADLWGGKFSRTNLRGANLSKSGLLGAKLSSADLRGAELSEANFEGAYFSYAKLSGANLNKSVFENTVFVGIDLSKTNGLEDAIHKSSSNIDVDTIRLSNGKIPTLFLRGCGLRDWEIESAKLYNPDLGNEEINKILYKMYELRGSQALQIAPLFISYSHGDGTFVDKLENQLNQKGIRFWRDVHDAKAGRLEKQIDRAMRLNPIVLLILSEHSIKSDWVEHEVRTARELEKELGRDVLCPVALDDSWKSSPWPKRVMEQIMEYNILDFSVWKDDSKFGNTFSKLIDGLGLFYKG